MVCKKNTGDLYWFGSRNTIRLVGEESYVLSCTEVLVVGVTSECEREELLSLKRRGENVGVSNSAGALARSRRVICSCLALCCYGGCSFFWLSSPRAFGMILVCSFYRLKEVLGYKILACDATLAGGGS
jgi:hypothetical protein